MKYFMNTRVSALTAVVRNRFFLVAIAIAAFLPLAANAQGGGGCEYEITSIALVFHLFGCILAAAVLPMLVTLSVVVFIIGILKYIAGADEAAKREEGRKFMIYGIVALFVMVSIWGLVGIIKGTFGIGTNVLIPQLMQY
jgi:hypothetical protein